MDADYVEWVQLSNTTVVKGVQRDLFNGRD